MRGRDALTYGATLERACMDGAHEDFAHGQCRCREFVPPHMPAAMHCQEAPEVARGKIRPSLFNRYMNENGTTMSFNGPSEEQNSGDDSRRYALHGTSNSSPSMWR